MFKRIFHFFDKLEDHIRQYLSRHPLQYTFIGTFSIIVLWSGVDWTLSEMGFLNGPILILIGVVITLATGVLGPFFVGDVIILSGLRKEKKVTEKTEQEVEEESVSLKEIKTELKKIEETLGTLTRE
ncbi:MAG: hypothetical protein WC757_01825 [Candidatus Paceibacterota bacterium]|jgi:hypothetical protein